MCNVVSCMDLMLTPTDEVGHHVVAMFRVGLVKEMVTRMWLGQWREVRDAKC